MVSGGDVERESRKKVTAVFADLAGSTTLAERLDPELFRQVVGAFFERMGATIERHGGAVENFIGDEIAGVFGAQVSHGDDALRAVRAAAEMLTELEALNNELEPRIGIRLGLRVGVNTGTVVVGPPIAGRAMALGDTMNVAARLEKRAEVGEILIGEETYRLVRRDIQAEPAGELDLRGRLEPIAAHRLLSAMREETGEPLADRPMVGRERDLMLLNVAFERSVARGSREFVTVLGEAGVGKSRIVAEMVERYRASAQVLVGRCLPYGEGITYWPLVEIVEQAAGIEDGDDAETARGRLEKLLRDAPEGAAIARHLAQLTGLDDSVEPGEHAFWAVRKLFEALSARRPLIVVFEDLQWAEPTLHELVLHISEHTKPGALLLACTARFELLDQRPGWREACPTTIALTPLGDGAISDLVGTLAGEGVTDEVRDRIVELAAGNPLFVEQVLSMLVDEGTLRRTPDGWELASDAGELSVPPSIDAILGARIDRLQPDERSLLEAAAVIGRDFSARSAATLAGVELGEHARRLVAKQLIERTRRSSGPGDVHTFRHILVRDAVYESLSRARRAELHERFADRLLEWEASRLGQVEEIVGYHLETAHRCRSQLLGSQERTHDLARRAAHHLIVAGRRAAVRQDDAAAAGLLTRAVALLAEAGADGAASRLEPLVELGTSLIRGGDTERAEHALAEARKAAVAAGDARAEARMRILELNLKRLTDPDWWTENGRSQASQVLKVFHDLGEDLDAAKAWHLLGKVHSDRGEQAAAAEALEHALELAQKAGDAGVEAWIRYWLLQASVFGPTPCDRVITRARDDVDWARARDNLALEGSTQGRLGEMLARSGRTQEAEAAFGRAREIFGELGLPVHVAYLAISTAAVEPLASDPKAAERELRPALDFFERIGARHIQATVVPMLAAALVPQGRVEEALELTDRGAELAAADDLDAQVRLRTARAAALTAVNRLPEAEAVAREAVAQAEPSDTLILLADSLECLGQVLLAARSSSEAVPQLERALELYDTKGDRVSASRTRATLDALTGTRFL